MFRPTLQRLPPKKTHFLHKPLFNRISLLEISLRVLYSTRYRCDPGAKIRMRAQKRQKCRVTHNRRRHRINSIDFRIDTILRTNLNRTPKGVSQAYADMIMLL